MRIVKVLVFGSGAVGIGLSSFLLQVGHRVHLVGNEKTVLALRKNGLQRQGIFELYGHRMCFVDVIPKGLHYRVNEFWVHISPNIHADVCPGGEHWFIVNQIFSIDCGINFVKKPSRL